MESAITAAIASSTATVTTVATDNLPTVFVVFGSLLALSVILRLVKRLIGRRA